MSSRQIRIATRKSRVFVPVLSPSGASRGFPALRREDAEHGG